MTSHANLGLVVVEEQLARHEKETLPLRHSAHVRVHRDSMTLQTVLYKLLYSSSLHRKKLTVLEHATAALLAVMDLAASQVCLCEVGSVVVMTAEVFSVDVGLEESEREG